MNNINSRYFYDKLSDVFDNNIKNLFNEEIEPSQKTQKYTIKIFDKTEINIEDDIFIESIGTKQKIFKEEYNKNGKIIFILYKNQKTILVDGRWDSAHKKPIEIKEKAYIGVYKNNLCGIINEKGIVKIKPIYSDILNSNNNIEILENNCFWFRKGKSEYNYGLVNMLGEELTPFEFFISGKKIFKNNNKKYIFGQTKSGEGIYGLEEKQFVIEKGKYRKIIFTENSDVLIVKDTSNKFGVLQEYVETIAPKYDDINILKNGLLLVTDNKKLGLLNLNNEVLVETKYNKITNQDDNTVSLNFKDEIFTFDKQGKLLKNSKIINN